MKSLQSHIYHITEDHTPANFGVTAVVTQLTRYLAGRGWPTTVCAAGVAETPVPERVGLAQFHLLPWGQPWRYSGRSMMAYLRGIGGNSGAILHLHGVWKAPQWQAARAACRSAVPAILSPHGMLNPWLWQDGRLRRVKKLTYWQTLAYPAFRHLPLIHAITPLERDNLASQFPGQRLEVIPNAIDLKEVDVLAGTEDFPDPPLDRPYLLFLGRLHVSKGVDLLITAFAQVSKRHTFRLLIAGPESTPGFTARLKAQVHALGLEEQVSFLGPIFGAKKWQIMRQAWAVCNPSHSEVVGMVNLEAAATRVPVVTTHETGLYDWEEGGGLLVHPRAADLARGLSQVLDWSESERNDRGRALRRLVEKRYCWEAVGPQWLELYASLR
jgi:glycosyltransferase involved in cell wall biosynthesis